MALKHNDFKVLDVTDVEVEIAPEDNDRRILFINNRGERNVYIGNSAGFNKDTESLLLHPNESHTWTEEDCPSNAMYAKCATGETSKIEVEDIG